MKIIGAGVSHDTRGATVLVDFSDKTRVGYPLYTDDGRWRFANLCRDANIHDITDTKQLRGLEISTK